MFYSWQEDILEKHKFSRDYSIMIGSFFNPQAASKLLGEGSTTFKSTDFDELSEAIALGNHDQPNNAESNKRKKRKRQIKNG